MVQNLTIISAEAIISSQKSFNLLEKHQFKRKDMNADVTDVKTFDAGKKSKQADVFQTTL